MKNNVNNNVNNNMNKNPNIGVSHGVSEPLQHPPVTNRWTRGIGNNIGEKGEGRGFDFLGFGLTLTTPVQKQAPTTSTPSHPPKKPTFLFPENFADLSVSSSSTSSSPSRTFLPTPAVKKSGEPSLSTPPSLRKREWDGGSGGSGSTTVLGGKGSFRASYPPTGSVASTSKKTNHQKGGYERVVVLHHHHHYPPTIPVTTNQQQMQIQQQLMQPGQGTHQNLSFHNSSNSFTQQGLQQPSQFQPPGVYQQNYQQNYPPQQQHPQTPLPFSPPRSSYSDSHVKSTTYHHVVRSPQKLQPSIIPPLNVNKPQPYYGHEARRGREKVPASWDRNLPTSSTPSPQISVSPSSKSPSKCEPPLKKPSETDLRLEMKTFQRTFLQISRSSYTEAVDFALEAVEEVSGEVKFKVFLELGELSKKLKKVGRLEDSYSVLKRGLIFCDTETLLVRAIRASEKMGRPDLARSHLAGLKRSDISKVWRTVLEGALMESRAGNYMVSRKVFQYLMSHVPWYGPIYYEAFRLEERMGYVNEAKKIVRRGLREIPRYGPLWSGAMRMDKSEELYEEARRKISKELVWKVWVEEAGFWERKFLEGGEKGADKARFCLSRAVGKCPNNLLWKVWLVGGRMELQFGRPNSAHKLFVQSYTDVPEKSLHFVFLELLRFEEYRGNYGVARSVLAKARETCGNEWKVFLESVLFEQRRKNFTLALKYVEKALRRHGGTGRLWAAKVQLVQNEAVLDAALNEVPKSGEVWCEGARVCLNPFNNSFGLTKAAKYLDFAIKFTPQYGDR
ncbi:hypothetical protein TL16_g10744 [Triparma laevis f. inornata]|uniref:Uncharacterized protein n=1 Tax=Triparma laevis f. inornata TaxID=1714386 RepID=A0A9W7BG84_9STRA|nr:hypothetical protein TL16_g10744 [Triparma laevis f. inornata]